MNRIVCAALTVAVGALAAGAAMGAVDLTGKWRVTGENTEWPFWQWTGDLYITQTSADPDRHVLAGTFWWEATDADNPGTASAWEDFHDGLFQRESYFNENGLVLRIEGYRLREVADDLPNGRIAVTEYTAEVSADGKSLLNGEWNGENVRHGIWSAERVGEFPSLSIGDVTSEGPEMVFTVTLSGKGEMPVSALYKTADGTAVAAIDYATVDGVVEIPPGETSATIRVPIHDKARNGTTFTVRLADVLFARTQDAEATGTIVSATPGPNDIPDDPDDPGTKPDDNGGGGGGCGLGVGPANLVGFAALCWLGLMGMKWHLPRRRM